MYVEWPVYDMRGNWKEKAIYEKTRISICFLLKSNTMQYALIFVKCIHLTTHQRDSIHFLLLITVSPSSLGPTCSSFLLLIASLQIRDMRYRLWEIITTPPVNSWQAVINDSIESIDKWFDGSSRNNKCGRQRQTIAKDSLAFWPPDNDPICCNARFPDNPNAPKCARISRSVNSSISFSSARSDSVIPVLSHVLHWLSEYYPNNEKCNSLCTYGWL